MTWEKLKEEAKKMGYSITKDCWDMDTIELDRDDDVLISFCIDGNIYINLTLLAEHRTPSQMLAIMKALQ